MPYITITYVQFGVNKKTPHIREGFLKAWRLS